MSNALVVGGANGVGLAIATQLATIEEVERIYIVDRCTLDNEYTNPKFKSVVFDLTESDYSVFDQFEDIKYLMITAGFGRLSLFENLNDDYIVSSFTVNSVAPIRIIKKFYSLLKGDKSFYCGVMVSIAGFMSSPFFSVYGATKAALKIFIESVNVELEKSGSPNRILNVSPGSIKGTSFNNGKTDLEQVSSLAEEIVTNLLKGNDIFIPLYDEVFSKVLERYHKDFREEGRHSYDYKLQSGRISMN